MKRTSLILAIIVAISLMAFYSLWAVNPLSANNRQLLVRINFQPDIAVIPSGYEPDNGMTFGERNNGFVYGWNADNSAGAYERNSLNAPDQRLDTLIYMQDAGNPNATWEIELPNGVYAVELVSGDPEYLDSIYRINVEGVLAINGIPTPTRRFLKKALQVTVNDYDDPQKLDHR